jgi:hypothetical protein
VTGDPGFITVSYGKQLTADDITKFNQQWMQPLEKAAALNFAYSTLKNLDSSGDTGNGERMAAMVRMFLRMYEYGAQCERQSPQGGRGGAEPAFSRAGGRAQRGTEELPYLLTGIA